MISICLLVFGKVDMKERVRIMRNYKKPAFWVVVLSIMICVVVAVCLLTDSKEDGTDVTPPAAFDQQTENTDRSTDDASLPDEREEEDGREVSPLLSITGEQIGTAALYKDEAGRITKKIETWNSGIEKETTYSYYPDGNKKEVTVYNGEALMRTKYREDGTIEVVNEEHAKGTLETTYTETGSRSKVRTEYPDGSWNEHTYDSEGHTLSWVQVDKDQLRRSWEFTYYENGNYKSDIYIDEAGGIRTESHYDEDGAIVSEITMYSAPKAHPEVVVSQVRTENFYDAEGNRTSKTEYKDGRIEEVRYDAKGNRVWNKVTKPDGTTEERYFTDGRLSRYIVNGEEIAVAGS